MPLCFSKAAASLSIAALRSEAAATLISKAVFVCAAVETGCVLALAASNNSEKRILLRADNHHLRRFDKRCSDIALLQAHLGDGVGGDDTGDHLTGNRQPNLRHQSIHLDLEHSAHQLVAAADLAKALPALGTGFDLAAGNKPGQLGFRNAMVAAGRGYCAQLARIDPLLQRGITDSQTGGS